MIFISEKYHYDGSLIFIIRMKHPATKVQLTWSRSLATTVFLSAAKKASFILSSWTFTKSKKRGTPSGVLTFFFNFGRRSTCFSWKKKWYPNYIYQTNIHFKYYQHTKNITEPNRSSIIGKYYSIKGIITVCFYSPTRI